MFSCSSKSIFFLTLSDFSLMQPVRHAMRKIGSSIHSSAEPYVTTADIDNEVKQLAD
jgi:hypothetical protein